MGRENGHPTPPLLPVIEANHGEKMRPKEMRGCRGTDVPAFRAPAADW